MVRYKNRFYRIQLKSNVCEIFTAEITEDTKNAMKEKYAVLSQHKIERMEKRMESFENLVWFQENPPN